MLTGPNLSTPACSLVDWIQYPTRHIHACSVDTQVIFWILFAFCFPPLRFRKILAAPMASIHWFYTVPGGPSLPFRPVQSAYAYGNNASSRQLLFFKRVRTTNLYSNKSFEICTWKYFIILFVPCTRFSNSYCTLLISTYTLSVGVR